ncbi:MAG TPA: HAD family phosphatase [Candidatus Hydrogenedentes bacterium]|nr:HAD family phosphatase [Candidatus Hydrogenedentota bacterium]HOJ68032.1 HAD family phosphatase [Candidatus Hydrogenedentota bacterium]HOK88958.1 HAD family phosphatase [Candidatus Hydrogenedentota bacterium]
MAYAFGCLFDVDGTMVDNHPFHRQAWIELGRRHGLPIDEAYYRQHIHSRDNRVIMVRMRELFANPDLPDSLADEKEAIYRELYRDRVTEIAGLRQLIEDLVDRGAGLAVASNAPPENVELVLEGLKIRDRFAAVLTPGTDLPGKPRPDLFLRAAALLGLPPGRCVVFEDSYSGFLAAEAAGMPCVAVTHGMSPVSAPYLDRTAIQARDFTEITASRVAELVGKMPVPGQGM